MVIVKYYDIFTLQISYSANNKARKSKERKDLQKGLVLFFEGNFLC